MILGAQWGLTKPSLGCWQGVALNSLVGVSVEVAQVRQLGFPELAVRLFPSWRAEKCIRGIPKGREKEEDSGAFQPCGLSSKQNCSY